MLIQITSLDHHDLELYSSLRENTQHWPRGYFVAEGDKIVHRLIASELATVSFLMTPKWYETLHDEIAGSRHADTPVYIAEPELLDRITGVTMHKRLMAIGKIPRTIEFTPQQLKACGTDPVIVALEGISDAENMGMIVRTCAGLGASALITGPDSTSPWLRRSVRVSMGTIFSLPTYRVPVLKSALKELRDSTGCRIVGSSPRGGAEALPSNRPVCLVFGSEGHGMSNDLLETCTDLWSIPMRNHVDSLNVAHTVAIALYEAVGTPGGRVAAG
jgi:tRNA G18 (ribose-2'-O)-methylase SpoU